MKIPESERLKRSQDVSNMLLPELVPDQLDALGMIFPHDLSHDFDSGQKSLAPGLALLQLLESRSKALANKGGLYHGRGNQEPPHQLELVRDNHARLMSMMSQLLREYPEIEPAHNKLYCFLDSILNISVMMGYYAGSNDALALTDRYTDLGYKKSVVQPQQGGTKKAEKYSCIKELVYMMASEIQQRQLPGKITKEALNTAIYEVIQEFSQQGENKNIPALKSFSCRYPEKKTIKNWLSAKRLSSSSTGSKLTSAQLVKELKSIFPARRIKEIIEQTI
ncbi:hypothetical protein [Shewanella algae]|uniref:hypothetical protein n=1 Tax=Shewanella algae TaxID=38313 RepID=UPI001AAE8189|nr:hypothetical protein [Shewanella algae]EKT4487404.1 hypothetical protein [Shewanella algae]MBO2546562.1 hypothetical protein [Shewanella algae]